jgi:hypothetical protein
MTPWEQPPLMHEEGYHDFMRGRAVLEQRQQAHAERLDRVRESTARMSQHGFWHAFKGWVVALVSGPLMIGLVVGLIAYFLDKDYKRAAAVGWGVPFALFLVYGVIVFTAYLFFRFLPLIIMLFIVGGLAIVGLHALGVVPKFW